MSYGCNAGSLWFIQLNVFMFKWLTFRKKSLAENTLEALERQRSKMTPDEVAAAEATLQRITEEVRASRASAREKNLVAARIHPGAHAK